MAGIQLSQLPVCRALPGKNTVVVACLVRLPGLKVYHLEKTNKQQILRCFDGKATWCGMRMHSTQNRALVYILPRPGSGSSPSLLWASVSHFIRGRSSRPLGCWELLMRGCMWKSFGNYNDDGGGGDDNEVSWRLLSASMGRAPYCVFKGHYLI